jgi:anti-sigma B factor antagonist
VSHHPLSIEVQPTTTAVTLALEGELDLATVGTLRACLDEVDAGFRTVVLDLAKLTFLDSSGIGLLARTRARFGPEYRELVLRNASGHVQHVLEISGFCEHEERGELTA